MNIGVLMILKVIFGVLMILKVRKDFMMFKQRDLILK